MQFILHLTINGSICYHIEINKIPKHEQNKHEESIQIGKGLNGRLKFNLFFC